MVVDTFGASCARFVNVFLVNWGTTLGLFVDIFTAFVFMKHAIIFIVIVVVIVVVVLFIATHIVVVIIGYTICLVLNKNETPIIVVRIFDFMIVGFIPSNAATALNRACEVRFAVTCPLKSRRLIHTKHVASVF